MKTYNLCLLGFGNVGQALLRLLEEKSAELRQRYDLAWRLTGVSTRRLGWRADPAGLDVAALQSGPAAAPGGPAPAGLAEWLAAARADVLFEVTSLNPHTGQPAIDHIRTALEAGVHVVTANKGPVVFAYQALRDLAQARGKSFLFEATVLDGAPVFSLFRAALPAVNLRRFRGVFNSTTNFVLTEVERGLDFEDAVETAQHIGMAETDPTADLDGWDAVVKVAALVTVLMGVPLPPDQVKRVGLGQLNPAQVRAARAAGRPYKLVGRAERVGPEVVASVGPEQVPLTDPLAVVSGTSTCVHFELDALPGLTIMEHQPSPATTAYGLLADWVNLVLAETGEPQ